MENIQIFQEYYIWGAIIVGSLQSLLFLVSFSNPDLDSLDTREQLMFFGVFACSIVLWPGAAISMIGRIIGSIRGWMRHRRQAKRHRRW